MADGIKTYLRPILAGIAFYILVIIHPLWGFNTSFASGLVIFFSVYLTSFLPTPFIAGNRKIGFLIGLVVTLIFMLPILSDLISPNNSTTSKYWLYVFSAFAGVWSSNAIINQLFGGMSDKTFTKALKSGAEEVISRREVTILSVDHRDESSISVETNTTDEIIFINDSATFIPHTTYNFKNNKRMVQDIWFKDKDGKEGRLQLVNRNIDIREDNNIALIYTSNGPLEYIENHNTGTLTPLYNYVLDYRDLAGKELKPIVYFSVLASVPFLGALISILSITAGYSKINKPIRRSYLGKSILWSALFVAVASSLLSWVILQEIMAGTISLEYTFKAMALTAMFIVALKIPVIFMLVNNSKNMETSLLDLAKT